MAMLSNFNAELLPGSAHVESLLLDLVVGAWQPTPLEETYLIDHLVECVHCKIMLAAFVVHMEDDCGDEPTGFSSDILTLLAETIHGTST